MNCPFINSNDPRCSENMNIQHLEEAFEFCTNHYTLCPVYIKLSNSQLEPVGAGTPSNPEI